MNRAVLILDCGATNVKACLADTGGKIIASHSLPNETVPDPFWQGGLIWDIDGIWNKLASCSRKICGTAKDTEIIAVTVTTFGVDGAAMKKDGTPCYPVISWQCQRTETTEKNIGKYFDRDWLYMTTGLQSYHFNTINKLIWLHENRPDVLDKMDYYVLMPSLILHLITGEWVTDTTMAGTSMLTEVRNRTFSAEILGKLGLSPAIFPPMVEPGKIIGKTTREASEKLGIKTGIDVVVSGHDTQFAIVGSGASLYQPVLSSGTWEILMVRAGTEKLHIPSRESGVTIELDSQPGFVNIGVQWVASGVLEWIGNMLYADLVIEKSRYQTMIMEAISIPAGSNGITVIPELFPGGFSGRPGSINGFTHDTTRGHIYRACLEALSFYSCYGLDLLQKAGNCPAQSIVCVGGGSKNSLWNQIRADVLGVPLKVPDIKETTAVGAALQTLTGIGVFKSTEEAFSAMGTGFVEFEPGKESGEIQRIIFEVCRIGICINLFLFARVPHP